MFLITKSLQAAKVKLNFHEEVAYEIQQKERLVCSFSKEENICALPLCTFYRCLALRIGPAAGLNCAYATKKENYRYERNTCIKKENLENPHKCSTRS